MADTTDHNNRLFHTQANHKHLRYAYSTEVWPPPVDDEPAQDDTGAVAAETPERCACGNGAPLYALPDSEDGARYCAQCWHKATGNNHALVEVGCFKCGNTEPVYDIGKPEHGKFYCPMCFRPLTPTPEYLTDRQTRGAGVFRPDLPLLNAHVEFGWPAATPIMHQMGRVIAQEGDWLLVSTGPGDCERVHRNNLIGTWFEAMSYGSMREAVLDAIDPDDDELLGAALVRLHRTAAEQATEWRRREGFEPPTRYTSPTAPDVPLSPPPLSKADIKQRARALRETENISSDAAQRQVVYDDTRRRAAIASLETRVAETRTYIATAMEAARQDAQATPGTLPQQAFALGQMAVLSDLSCLIEHADKPHDSEAAHDIHFDSCIRAPHMDEHLVRHGIRC